MVRAHVTVFCSNPHGYGTAVQRPRDTGMPATGGQQRGQGGWGGGGGNDRGSRRDPTGRAVDHFKGFGFSSKRHRKV